jgi:hypothetical protein
MGYHIRTPYCVTRPDKSTIYVLRTAPHNLGVKRQVAQHSAAQRIKRGQSISAYSVVLSGVLRDCDFTEYITTQQTK